MGGGCSTLDKQNVSELERHRVSVDRRKGDLPFQQLLASLPKLFCESGDNSNKCICSCTVSPNCKSIMFGCADVHRAKFYQKEVPMDELKEIKNALDINSNLEWPSFFASLKESFEKKTLTFEFESNQSGNESCLLNLELNLDKIGRASIQFKLRETNNRAGTLSHGFLNPLFDFYAIQTESSTAEKVDELERKLNLMKEKYIFLKNQRKKTDRSEYQESSHEEYSGDDFSVAPTKKLQNRGTRSRMDYPNEDILKFLKGLKKKLIASKAMTEKEQDSFNCLMNTISFDNLYKLDFSQRISTEIDPDVVAWIKNKFSVDSQDETQRMKKGSESTVSASDFRKSVNLSKINKVKTRQDIMAMFDRVDEWNFDVFTLEKLTEGRTLFITGYTLFLKYDLVNKFNMDEQVLINWLQNVESGYHQNPYHNAIHAADVLQVLHFVIYKCKLSQYMSDEDILAALIAAMIHDYDHPGLNNNFHINAESYLATLYNDRSVLEHHHCSQAFDMMRSDKNNILQTLTVEQQKDIRETIIGMVLATDMSQHAKYVGKFNSRIDTDVDFSAKDDVRLALQMAIKMADVSNPSRPTKLYLRWASRLETEFFKQGDKERELSLGISPFMDRQKPSMNNLQHAFITYIVNPMYESLFKLLPRLRKYTKEHIANNLAYWADHDEIDVDDIRDEE